MIRFLCLIIVGFAASLTAGESIAADHRDSQNTSSVSATIQRAIPYLIEDGQSWIDNRGCVSCHQIPFMVWSLSAAQRRGHDVDADSVQQWTQWSVQPASFVRPDQREEMDETETLSKNIDTMNALLLAGDDIAVPESTKSRFLEALASEQQPNGSWRACGQLPLQKRPSKESHQVTSLWSLLILHRNGITAHDTAKALEFAGNDKPASTEWLVARLLVANALNESEQVTDRLHQLLESQNQDGGWGWLIGETSDALATGMTVYALSSLMQDHPSAKPGDTIQREFDAMSRAIESAQEFLLQSQRPDGSWPVPGTKKNARNKPTATAVYWGTAWAVIGLLHSTPVPAEVTHAPSVNDTARSADPVEFVIGD